MQFNNTNSLMNTLMYDALKNAGAKEKDARAAATEAARSDMRSITLEYAINKLRSHVDNSKTELHSHVDNSKTELHSHVDSSMTKLRGEMTELRRELSELRSHVGKSMAELRSHVDKSMAELRSDIKQSQIEMTKIMLLSSATSAGVLAVAIAAATYFIQIL